MQQLIQHYGVFFAGLIVFAGELGVPTGMPVEVVLLLTGSYALHSPAGLALGVALVTVADLLGSLTLNMVVRTGGARLLRRVIARHAQEPGSGRLARWRGRLDRHAVPAVFVGRLLPLVRMYTTVAAGLIGVPFRAFALGALPASFLWAGSPVVLGYLARSHVHRLAAEYARLGRLAILLLPLAGITAGAVWWLGASGAHRRQPHLVRLVIGALALAGIVAYLIDVMGEVDAALDRGRGTLISPFLWLWLVVLALLAAGVVAIAIQDLRTGLRSRSGPSGAVRREFAATLLWIALVLCAGGLMLSLEWRYPAL